MAYNLPVASLLVSLELGLGVRDPDSSLVVTGDSGFGFPPPIFDLRAPK